MSTADKLTLGISRRQVFEATFSGAQDPPWLPRLRSDRKPIYAPLPHSLQEFRDLEGEETRLKRLRNLWRQLPKPNSSDVNDAVLNRPKLPVNGYASMTPERAKRLKALYENELLIRCGDSKTSTMPTWKEFKTYADAKEGGTPSFALILPVSLPDSLVRSELWSIFHDELDLDGNGHLDADELALALSKAGEWFSLP
jgi:solute carrier family 25 phosphate transporter 23/24/25/41